MRLPAWLTFSCAAMVILWGLYRMRLGLRGDVEQRRAPKGLFAMARRTHLLIGFVYVLLGSGLIAIGLGWNPLADAPKPQPAEPESQDVLIDLRTSDPGHGADTAPQ